MNNSNKFQLKIPEVLTPAKIEQTLKTSLIGREFKHFLQLDSTNDETQKLASQGEREGLVVISEVQLGGKGRLGRQWFSPSGGIWLSILLRPKVNPAHASKLTLMTGVAVAQTIRATTGLSVKLKWPNDVLINDKKVSGILTELNASANKIEFVVVGIGINANIDSRAIPYELRDIATSLQIELGREISRVEFVSKLLANFEKLYFKYTKQNFGTILQTWGELSDTIHRYVKVVTETEVVEGKAVELGTNGELIIETETGAKKSVIAGDCIYLR